MPPLVSGRGTAASLLANLLRSEAEYIGGGGVVTKEKQPPYRRSRSATSCSRAFAPDGRKSSTALRFQRRSAQDDALILFFVNHNLFKMH